MSKRTKARPEGDRKFGRGRTNWLKPYASALQPDLYALAETGDHDLNDLLLIQIIRWLAWTHGK